MPKIKINDISMYYEVHGQGEPLVFISGFSADHLGWAGILNTLSKHYKIILLNNRGSGQTDIPEGLYTIDQMAQDTADLCAALSIKKAHFLGNSMGGYIVQTIARQFSSLVKSVVISNSAMQTHTPFHIYIDAHLALMKTNAPVELLTKAMCSWAFSYDFLKKDNMLNTLIEWGKNNPYPMTLTGYEGQYAALDKFDSREWLHDIHAPALVIAADSDFILPATLSRAIADIIPNAQYYCFENCGHLPHIEQPEKYAEIVSAFLKNVT